MWKMRNRWFELWPIYGMAALFLMTSVAFFVFGRYRFPVVPALALFAGPVVADIAVWTRSLFAAIKQRRPRPVLAVPNGHIVLFLLLFVTAHLPLVSAREAASVTYNNFAIQALLRGEHDLTELFVSRSIALNPKFSLAYNTRGVMHRERGDAVRAIADFENAISISPDYQTARQNLNRIVNRDEHDAVRSGGAQ
jgi:hypothetical protein